MKTRPVEIEELMDIIDNASFDFTESENAAWNKICQYIDQLELFKLQRDVAIAVLETNPLLKTKFICDYIEKTKEVF